MTTKINMIKTARFKGAALEIADKLFGTFTNCDLTFDAEDAYSGTVSLDAENGLYYDARFRIDEYPIYMPTGELSLYKDFILTLESDDFNGEVKKYEITSMRTQAPISYIGLGFVIKLVASRQGPKMRAVPKIDTERAKKELEILKAARKAGKSSTEWAIVEPTAEEAAKIAEYQAKKAKK